LIRPKKSAKKPVVHEEEAGPSRPKKKESTLKKMKEIITHSFSLCTYAATQAYDARKDINRLLSHHGLTTQSISPPIFFDEFSSREEEVPVPPQHISSEDEEPLGAKLQKMKGEAKPTPRGIRRGVKGTAGRGKRPPSDEDEDLDSEDSSEDWSGSS
jgi:hypothetical protein